MTNATTLESIREQAQGTMDGPAPKRPASPPVSGSVCPYCGHRERADAEECSSCRGLFEPLSRIATQNAMGPWQIRDEMSPFRPGCSIETLRALIRKGKLTRESVIRGPSTKQFWRTVAQTPGVSHLLGVCHACAAAANADQHHCRSCGVSFLVEADRNRLGLDPVRPIHDQAHQTDLKPVGIDAAPEQTHPAPAFLDLFSAPPAGGVRPSMDSRQAAEHRRQAGSRPARHAVAAATVALGAAALSVAVWAASAAGTVVEPAKTPAPAAMSEPEPRADAPSEAAPETPSEAELEAWRVRIDEAEALGDTEDIDSLEEAIEALRDIQTSAPTGVLPGDLDERIEALERRLDDLTLARFLERDGAGEQNAP